MEEIDKLIAEIVQQCAARGIAVPEVLAALVARTVIETANGAHSMPLFSLDAPLSSEGINKLIDVSVARLLADDSPPMETLRMQVAFDTTYVREEKELEVKASRRAARLKELQRAIVQLKPRDGADFEALTTMHRQIFTYLLKHAHEGSEADRTVEREVAAALESVFPRISLKAFITLTSEEKYAQLEELASIVFGIRLFNKHIGKGGNRVPDADADAAALLAELSAELLVEVEQTQIACRRYQDVIVLMYMHQPQGLTIEVVDRWKDELANRRQYLAYLQSVQEDVIISERKVRSVRERLARELSDLRQLVENKASVPKEHVYPKFDEVSTQWRALFRELQVLRSREAAYAVLRKYKASYTSTLVESMDVVRAAYEEQAPAESKDAPAIEAHSDSKSVGSGRGSSRGSNKPGSSAQQDDPRTAAVTAADVTPIASTDEMIDTAAARAKDKPVRLSIESTPEFMQLPLEFQGFCPWTIVNRRGLLLPGRPELGVQRWRNAHYVFAHKVAAEAFQKSPEALVHGVLERAMQSPELIHLLRLQDSFPNVSIMRMLRGDGLLADGGAGAAKGPAAVKCDAGTETPLHFADKNIDHSYSWNEWTLRRKALQIANLRKCATTAQQTDDSHFRRENTTQVWLPRLTGTQTMRSSGNNPPRQVRFTAEKDKKSARGLAV
ncbi:hypothetical protein JKP88DRAFT_257717 [Tribonema minus]|uniref:Cilia- and flagella-associated protein 206 n=1 Tax=Tribonema minus TaxID=303371 RepID=A0A835YXN0_9STRA|nr:hypothetical protein JKP88DRAFT_257717 [Tribonema minus]